MNNATFRRTSRPVKSAASYRALTEKETAEYVKRGTVNGKAVTIAHAAYLRMCVEGAEDVLDGLYEIES